MPHRSSRREMLLGSAALLSLSLGSSRLEAAPQATEVGKFSSDILRGVARDLATRPYAPPDEELPHALGAIGYDEYRSIAYRPEHALWRGEERTFELQLFHRGFLYPPRIQIHEVVDGVARQLRYARELFTAKDVDLSRSEGDLGFSGFRLHAPINVAHHKDEFLVFQGASYFRAVGRNQIYGLSARGLALGTGVREEFPIFRSFWIERPGENAGSVVVHGLLDSESVTGAYRFTARPGVATVLDVEATLYPRVDLHDVGISPPTSMYFLSPSDPERRDDYRPSVHDSEGLEIWTGRGERLWRPLANPPASLQITAFPDADPRGFGLMQRRRRFQDYQDIHARYEDRPSLWVEPVGSWGEGEIRLFEFPTGGEYGDNIVASWRPKAPLLALGEYRFNYRLHWGGDVLAPPDTARFVDTLSGVGGAPDSRFFALNAEGGPLKDLPPGEPVAFTVKALGGKVIGPGIEHNHKTGGRRLAFTVVPEGEGTVDLQAQLKMGDRPISELWHYRWQPKRPAG